MKTPICKDKSRIYDFAGSSIEHIYPQNALTKFREESLEPLKNTLGNLTLQDPAQNTLGGNNPFADKRSPHQESTVLLTRDVAANSIWTKVEIENHKKLLIDIALKVFYP